MPLPLAKKSHQSITELSKELDKDLLDGLRRKGFKLDYGEDGTGWQFKYLTRGGGYYFNVGCSDLVVRGEIGLRPFSDIQSLVAEAAQMKGGKPLSPALILLAAADKGQQAPAPQYFGDTMHALC